MPALANFLRNELPRRGWTIPEWAPRADLSVSAAYLIIRDGKDNVRQDTLDNIAASFNMAPAELLVAIGKGAADDSPARAPLVALLRQVPDADLGTVDRVVRPFAVAPTQQRTNRRADPSSKRREATAHKLERGDLDDPKSGPEETLPSCYQTTNGRLRTSVVHSFLPLAAALAG